jgi:hypothetical protein
MKRTGAARAIAVIFLGVILGTYIHFSQMRTLARGREQYLAERAQHFDRIAVNHGALPMVIAGVILVAIAIVIYEAVVAGIASILPLDTTEM